MHRRCASLQPTQKGHLSVSFALVAEVGFEPHDLRVMSPTSCQTAPLRDIMVPEAGVEPVREKISRDFKSRASANSAIPASCDQLIFRLPNYYSTFFLACQYLLQTFYHSVLFIIDYMKKTPKKFKKSAFISCPKADFIAKRFHPH